MESDLLSNGKLQFNMIISHNDAIHVTRLLNANATKKASWSLFTINVPNTLPEPVSEPEEFGMFASACRQTLLTTYQ